MSAVPCLSYRKSLEEDQTKTASEEQRPDPKIQTAENCIQSQNVAPLQLNDYCKKLFKFKQVKIMKFKSWSERRRFAKKLRRCRQRPTLPDGKTMWP